MDAEMIVRLAGGYNILCAIIHVLFPKMLRWKKDLASLAPANRAGMKIMNLCLMVFWLIFGYLYLFHAPEIAGTGLGRSILMSMIVFWVARIFILQPVYLGLKTRASVQMVPFFLIGLVLNILPLVIG
ncbi:MAG: hypothetical protein KJ621_09715 [Proteobacteria bacterium]|nr:hypothetical protein [Pseudomonadota bacterium]MBU1742068.1 hypothetical protein [Pseudomonadota bacterium]